MEFTTKWRIFYLVTLFIRSECLEISNDRLSWMNAARRCRGTNGNKKTSEDLVCITNDTDDQNTASLHAENTKEFWIGNGVILEHRQQRLKFTLGCAKAKLLVELSDIRHEFANNKFNVDNCQLYCNNFYSRFYAHPNFGTSCLCFDEFPQHTHVYKCMTPICCKEEDDVIYDGELEIKQCLNIRLTDGKVCYERTNTCHRLLNYICSSDEKCSTKISNNTFTKSGTTVIEQIPTCERTITTAEGSSTTMTIVVVILLVVLVIIVSPGVAFFIYRRSRSQKKKKTTTNDGPDIGNAAVDMSYEKIITVSASDNIADTEYTEISPPDENKQVNYTSNYETPSDISDGYFILESGSNIAVVPGETENDYVHAADGDYDRLHGKAERKPEVEGQNNVYAHANTDGTNESAYDTTKNVKHHENYDTTRGRSSDEDYSKLSY